MNAAMRRAVTDRAGRHLYGFEDGRMVVREPENAGGARVCVLDGDPAHPATILQADAICAALDRMMRAARLRGEIE